MTYALLVAAVLVIGVSLGATGYGGFIVPILLILLLDLDPRTAVAHGLVSFVIPGLIGAWLSWRTNRPPWRLAVLLCLGTVPGVLLGRLASVSAPSWALQLAVAALVMAGGASVLWRGRQRRERRPPRRSVIALAAVGAGLLAGVASVLAGVGGPLVTVPVLLALGLELGPVVAAALVNAVFSVAVGAGALADQVHLDWGLVAVLTGAQAVGMPVGVWLQTRLANRLVPVVALLALGSGGWLLWRTVAGSY